jgi:hypothetical protein
MLKRAFFFLILTMFLISTVTVAFSIQTAKAASEIIIDTHGDGRFTKYPSGPYWWSVADHDVFHTRAYNNNFWYTYCGEEGQGELYFGMWQASLPQSGAYEVFVWIPNPDAFGTYTPTQSASYQIYHRNGMDLRTVNQRSRTGNWSSIGTYTFDTTASVILNDRTGEPYLSTMLAFDAIKFVGPEVSLRTLTVSSAHDSPNPSNGQHTYNDGSSVTCSVSSPVTEGSTIWNCTGWSGTGSVPSSGSVTSVTFTIYQTSSITWNWIVTPPVPRTLTVYSSPSGVSFTANGVSHSTPWSEAYAKDTLVSLEMDSDHYAAGPSRYYWYQWSDGVASMSRTVILSSDTTVTGSYVGPYYQLDIVPSADTPSGIPFTLNGVTNTTPYSEWLYQGYYTVEMPATYNGYVWQYWLLGGGESRITTVSLTSTSVTLIFVYAAPYEPSLSIPVYAPSYQSAHQGTTLAFIFRVSNVGGTTDTINLHPRNQRAWNSWLSEDSVRLEQNQGKDVYLYLAVGGKGDNIITVEGTSEADPSKTSSCEVIANGYGDGYGLFNVELKFSNTGIRNARLLFNVPVYVKISASEIYLPGLSDSEASIYVAFDPTSWINDEPGLNGFLINVEELQSGGTAAIPVKFDEYVTAATDFDLTEDSYSFENGLYEYDTCYGMAATAIHNRGMATYDKTKDEAKFDIKLHQGDADNWLLGLTLMIPFNSPTAAAESHAAEYTKLKKSINLNVPMILALRTPTGVLHAVVAYKIVESGSKAYILCYDNNEPFSSLSDPRSFTYAIYDTTTSKLLFCYLATQFEECNFLVHEPAEHPIVNWVVIYEGKSWAQQIVEGLDWKQQIMIIRCPVNVTITDQYGRIVSDNGTNQIPNAAVASTNDMKCFRLPLELNYSVFISAYGSGDFNLMIVKPTVNSSVSLDIYENVSVDFGAQVTLEIEPYEMNQTMKIDSDGNGVIDELRNPSVSEAIYIPPLSYTFAIVWGEETFIVSVESNSTVTDFAFSQPDKEISFDVTGSADIIGFCNVTIPKALLYGPWVVLIDGASVLPMMTENATHGCLYFTYTHSTHAIQIIGTWVIGQPLDVTPPNIIVSSPLNRTYLTSSVPLTFFVDEPTSWIAYCLDGETNITIVGNTTLAGLLEGTHSVIIYANDTRGNMGSSDIVYFTVFKPLPGDVDGDMDVDIDDIYLAALGFGTTPESFRWNERADLNEDGYIGIDDIFLIASNFGKEY